MPWNIILETALWGDTFEGFQPGVDELRWMFFNDPLKAVGKKLEKPKLQAGRPAMELWVMVHKMGAGT